MEAQRKNKGQIVELNLIMEGAVHGQEYTPALTVFADSTKKDLARDILVQQKEYLIAQGVYFVPRGQFSDVGALSYKDNMFQLQKELDSVYMKSMVLYDFQCENEVQNCAYV